MPTADDEEEWVTAVPSEVEATLARNLGPAGVRAVDAALCRHSGRTWRKAALVLANALGEAESGAVDSVYADLYVRRLIALVDSGVLEAQGNLRRPRWSEVRLAR